MIKENKFINPLRLSEIPFHVEKGRGSCNALYASKEDFINNKHKTVGMELEVTQFVNRKIKSAFTDAVVNSTQYLLALARAKSTNFSNLIALLDASKLPSSSYSSNDITLKYVMPNTSPIIHECVFDGSCGPEMIMLPVSKAALPMFKIELAKVCHHLRLIGAEEQGRGAGIHFHMDKTFWGEEIHEQYRNIENFYMFLRYNAQFINEFSYRGVRDERSVDFESMILGDTENAQMMILKMKAAKMELAEAFTQGRCNREGSFNGHYGIANNVTNANNLPLHEIRIFGSTLDVDRIMSFKEYIHMLPEVVKQLNYDFNTVDWKNDIERSLNKFVDYLIENREEYPHLFNNLKNNSFTEDMLKDYKNIEVPNYSFDDLQNSKELHQRVFTTPETIDEPVALDEILPIQDTGSIEQFEIQVSEIQEVNIESQRYSELINRINLINDFDIENETEFLSDTSDDIDTFCQNCTECANRECLSALYDNRIEQLEETNEENIEEYQE